MTQQLTMADILSSELLLSKIADRRSENPDDPNHLPNRAFNALVAEGDPNIIYMAELVAKTENELFRIPNIGKQSIADIKKFLSAMENLELGVEVTDMPKYKTGEWEYVDHKEFRKMLEEADGKPVKPEEPEQPPAGAEEQAGPAAVEEKTVKLQEQPIQDPTVIREGVRELLRNADIVSRYSAREKVFDKILDDPECAKNIIGLFEAWKKVAREGFSTDGVKKLLENETSIRVAIFVGEKLKPSTPEP